MTKILYLLFFLAFVVFAVFLFLRSRRKITKHTVKGRHSTFLINGELNYVFGLPGSGKSTLLAAVAQACYEQGIPCFSSFPIKHAYQWQGFEVTYPVGSVFLFDEIYDMVGSGTNRGIPEKEVTMFFKLFRHSRYTIWACSQEADDVARRVRGIVTQSYVMQNIGKCSKLMSAEIKEVKNEDGTKYDLKVDSRILGFFFDYRLMRPHFYDDFDSYCRKEYTQFAEFHSWSTSKN